MSTYFKIRIPICPSSLQIDFRDYDTVKLGNQFKF